MAESKIDATERLRKEGCWEAASLFRDERRNEAVTTTIGIIRCD